MKQVLSENVALINDYLILEHPTTIFTDDSVVVDLFGTKEDLYSNIAFDNVIAFNYSDAETYITFDYCGYETYIEIDTV